VPSPDYDADRELLDVLGLKMRPPFKEPKRQPVPAAQPLEV
jgi:biotin synthase